MEIDMSERAHIVQKSIAGLVALLVSGASASAMQYQALDYSYAGNYGTVVAGMSGGHAGGYSRYDFYVIDHQKRYRFHAIYWPDANAAPVELNPFNSPYSQVSAVSGNRQVGTASVLINGTYYARAILWRGTAKSARDITMTGYDNSSASGLHGNQVVGQANGNATGGYVHAVVWDLKNSSIADLNGSDHQESGAVATNGTQQVGWATDPSGADDHACYGPVRTTVRSICTRPNSLCRSPRASTASPRSVLARRCRPRTRCSGMAAPQAPSI